MYANVKHAGTPSLYLDGGDVRLERGVAQRDLDGLGGVQPGGLARVVAVRVQVGHGGRVAANRHGGGHRRREQHRLRRHRLVWIKKMALSLSQQVLIRSKNPTRKNS